MKPSLVFLRGDLNASSYYRAMLPATTLASKGYEANTWPTYDDFLEADIVVFHRPFTKKILEAMISRKSQGKKNVVDWDDNCFQLEPHNPEARILKGETLNTLGAILEIADAITVTVEPLAASYERFGSSVFVLPNCVDGKTLDFSRKPAAGVIVGWQGSDTHLADLQRIKSVINNLQRKLDFEFVLAGYRPQGMFRKSTFRRWMDFSDELTHQQIFSDFSIGLCPLADNAFNECKSDLKFLEYGSLGIPTVASRIVTYDTIRNGETGYIARNVADWERRLSELITDESLRTEIGNNAKEYVASERTIQGNIGKWEEVYGSL